MNKVRCILDTPYFTKGKEYYVIKVDENGDVWTIDDDGDRLYMYPEECEEVA